MSFTCPSRSIYWALPCSWPWGGECRDLSRPWIRFQETGGREAWRSCYSSLLPGEAPSTEGHVSNYPLPSPLSISLSFLFSSLTHPWSLMLSAQSHCITLVVPYMGVTTLNILFISYSSNYLFLPCQSFLPNFYDTPYSTILSYQRRSI